MGQPREPLHVSHSPTRWHAHTHVSQRLYWNLDEASGLDVLVGAAFRGLTSIMNGKAWVRSMRAFRIVTAVLLFDFVKDGPKTFEDIDLYLETAREHPTGRLWVDCLVRPTLIAHQFERAERESDFLLQHHCYQQMLPYFFAAAHWQYARYITWHVMEMKTMLPDDAKTDLLAGAHVCLHKPGTWNAVSADQFGEQTYIKNGKLPGGLKGLTLSADQVAIWVESYPVCAHVHLPWSPCMQVMKTSWRRSTRRRERRGACSTQMTALVFAMS